MTDLLKRNRLGYTLVELVMVFLIANILFFMGYRTLTSLRRSSEPGLSNRLMIQMEARKAADNISDMIRSSSEIIRPLTGETTPFLVTKDLVNNICLYYLIDDRGNSEKFQKKLFKLISYTHDYSGGYSGKNEKLVCSSIKSVTFTSTTPSSVTMNATLAAEKGEFQFITEIGIMNLGDIE
ncbi:MAG: hypothetical protein HQM10_09305 [Candidatus Riflebacteria bacterium]|nr:hypothetical protein [Candidatus Riflebacteria bacterium]